MPSPSRTWHDHRASTRQYESTRDYRAEVGGLVPGYKGHVPAALRKIGGSNYGGLITRQGFPDHMKWAQSRHDAEYAQAKVVASNAAAGVAATSVAQQQASAFLFDKTRVAPVPKASREVPKWGRHPFRS